MATPTGEPYGDAMGEAVQASVMAWRLVMAVADAVRRQQQRRQTGKEADLPPADQALGEAAGELKGMVPKEVATPLMTDTDWPQMAQQLVALQRAGVDLADFLPRVGDIAATVRDAVEANTSSAARESTGQWGRLLRKALPAGPVREAILASPAWPEIAATMARLDERGVDMRQLLAFAHDEGVSVDQAVARKLGADTTPLASRDAMLSYGPLTTGLDIPKDLVLGDRERALQQLAILPDENRRYMQWVVEAMPGREREANLLITARQWPLVAARMAQAEDDDRPVREHLARLVQDTTWEQGPRPLLGARLVEAANEVLLRPVGEADVPRVMVNTTAARAHSATVDPIERQLAKLGAAAQAPIAPHRQLTGPTQGRSKAR